MTKCTEGNRHDCMLQHGASLNHQIMMKSECLDLRFIGMLNHDPWLHTCSTVDQMLWRLEDNLDKLRKATHQGPLQKMAFKVGNSATCLLRQSKHSPARLCVACTCHISIVRCAWASAFPSPCLLATSLITAVSKPSLLPLVIATLIRVVPFGGLRHIICCTLCKVQTVKINHTSTFLCVGQTHPKCN